MMADETQICRDIFSSVRIGDLKTVQEFLDSHPKLDINVRNDENETLLIYCVKRVRDRLGQEWTLPFGGEFSAICETIIKRNIDVNQTDSMGNTALHYVVEIQDSAILKLLIRNGARLDISRKDGVSALDLIVQKGEVDWVRVICEALTANPEYIIPSGEKTKRKLFHRFLSTKYQSCISWMCKHCPEMIETRNEESFTGLHVTVVENNVDALKVLLEFRANTEVVDKEGHTGLHFAVVYGHVDCLVHLLENGAGTNCQDGDGLTPLHYAISTAPDHGNDNYGDSLKSNIIIEHLLNYGASVSLADYKGRLPLHWAANLGNANVCKMMVSKGCPVNTPCRQRLTALHMAASQGHTECVQVLVVQCRADVNMPDKCGYSPLFNAITMGHTECAELLLYHGALPDKCNIGSNSPAHCAATEGLTSALEILNKYKGSLELENLDGDRPLHKAAFLQRLDAVDYMLKCECKVNVRNRKGFTPLHLAACAGSAAVCNRLLAGGASLNDLLIKRKNGNYQFLTPLDLASLNKQLDCLQLLKNMGGIPGKQLTNVAARKIQKYWRTKRFKRKSLECPEQRDETSFKHSTETEDKMKDKMKENRFTEAENKDDRIIELETKSENRTECENRITEDENAQSLEKANDVETVTGDLETLEISKLDTISAAYHSDAEPIQVLTNQNSETSTDAKERSNHINNSPVIQGSISSTSTATDSVSCDKRDLLGEENAGHKDYVGLEEPREGIKKSINEKRKKGSASVVQKTNGSLKDVQLHPTTCRKKKVPKSTERKYSNRKETNLTDDVITSSHVVEQVKLENTKLQFKQHSCQSSDENLPEIKQNLQESLDAEISKTEKLRKELARIKKNFEERSHTLDERLKSVERKLR